MCYVGWYYTVPGASRIKANCSVFASSIEVIAEYPVGGNGICLPPVPISFRLLGMICKL